MGKAMVALAIGAGWAAAQPARAETDARVTAAFFVARAGQPVAWLKRRHDMPGELVVQDHGLHVARLRPVRT